MILKTVEIKSRVYGERVFEPGEIVFIESECSSNDYIICGIDGIRVYVASFELDFSTLQEVSIRELPQRREKSVNERLPLETSENRREKPTNPFDFSQIKIHESTAQGIIGTAQNDFQ